MEKSQREYYLNEQIKAIQKELGDIDDAAPNDLEELQNKINAAGMPAEAKEKSQNELNKLKNMSSQSSDASIIRTYIENLCLVPWSKKSENKPRFGKSSKNSG